jgi:hypothetical protein
MNVYMNVVILPEIIFQEALWERRCSNLSFLLRDLKENFLSEIISLFALPKCCEMKVGR